MTTAPTPPSAARPLRLEPGAQPVVDDADFKRFLRFPPTRPFEGPLAVNAAWARDWFAAHARPWLVAVEVDAQALADGLALAGQRFGGPALARHFPELRRAAVIAASAGAEAETEALARWQADEPDRYYFLECYASAAVEALLAEARQRCGAPRHYCPGFPDWPIQDAAPLLALVVSAGPLPGPLGVLASGMLRPKKSQLALCALTP